MSTPGLPKRERVVAYVDGFNLYFGIREAGYRPLLWLDVPRLVSLFARDYQDVVLTKYFTSIVSSDKGKKKRQGIYIEALEQTHAGAQLKIVYGKYQEKNWFCGGCKHPTVAFNEKQTDVNIAVSLLEDAIANAFDTAFLITGDSDLVPAIESIKRWHPAKRVVVIFPPKRVSDELRSVAHAHLYINPIKLRSSQLPTTVLAKNGTPLAMPIEWNHN